ncbi:MAG: hypothetical protein JXQ84_01275 [Rhodospirillaceae bacterium]|nr:hypothetical protein [Rhodospirillaceae bacterium]
MAKGQQRGNREVKKPKKKALSSAAPSPTSDFATVFQKKNGKSISSPQKNG